MARRCYAFAAVVLGLSIDEAISFHELGYFDEIAIQNARVNPGGLLPEAFFALCLGDR